MSILPNAFRKASHVKVFSSSLLIFFGLALPANAEEAQTDSATKQFHALLDEHWEWTLKTNPLEASQLGDKRYNDRWPDLSLEAFARQHKYRQELLQRLRQIPADELQGEDSISYRLFELKLR